MDQNLYVDNRQGAYEATQHLIRYGHRKIATITGTPGRLETVHRLEGYKNALADHEIEVDERLICEGDFLAPSGVLAVESLMARGVNFSAIFCCNDEVAFGVRLALARHGLRVPEDISLVGFDDHHLSAFMMPPLTTVRQPAYELGYEAAKALIGILEDQPVDLPKLETDLIIRNSVSRR
jgi:LacI family transcriptional regulator